MNLSELKRADPGTYQSIVKWGLNWNHPDEVFLSECIIQVGLQRAIEKWGWNWNLNETNKQYCAMIASFNGVYDGFSDSSAEALLAAYLEAFHE